MTHALCDGQTDDVISAVVFPAPRGVAANRSLADVAGLRS